MKAVKKKRIRNISDEELSAIKSLKSNKDIVMCKVDKGSCIVVLDKTDYINKTNKILQRYQFKSVKISPTQEKEKIMNRCLMELYKENVIDK